MHLVYFIRLKMLNKRINIYIFAISFLSLFVFANFFTLILNGSSMRTGLTIGIFIFLSMLFFVEKGSVFLIRKKYFLYILVILSLIFIQFLVSKIIFVDTDDLRFIMSYVLLLILFIISVVFVYSAYKVKEKSFYNVLLLSYIIVLIVGILSTYLVTYNLIDNKFMSIKRY